MRHPYYQVIGTVSKHLHKKRWQHTIIVPISKKKQVDLFGPCALQKTRSREQRKPASPPKLDLNMEQFFNFGNFEQEKLRNCWQNKLILGIENEFWRTCRLPLLSGPCFSKSTQSKKVDLYFFLKSEQQFETKHFFCEDGRLQKEEMDVSQRMAL